MDKINKRILNSLLKNGRISITNLSKEVGLSIPAVTERVRKLEDQGFIEGYVAVVNPEKIGFPVSAIIGITAFKPQKNNLLRDLKNMPEVFECLHVTGDDSYLIKIFVQTNKEVESFVARINIYGETRTRIILSAPIPWSWRRLL